MTEYRIEYRNDDHEWENIESLGYDMSTGLDDEQEAIETFNDLLGDFDDNEIDCRLIEIDDDELEIIIKKTDDE